MSDKLKRFIEDNREEFDNENPSPQVLKNLKKQWNENDVPKKTPTIKLFRRAAAISGLIIVSAVVYFIAGKKNDEPVIVKETPPVKTEEISILDPVYAKQISQFKEIIGLKQIELKQLEKEQPELYKQFMHDINRLDSAYRELKTSLPENPNTEILLEAMIRNLQLQSDLLNRQLLIINEIKQKSKTHEKNII